MAVIGDFYHDIDMLEMTPQSYVMATADHVVKQAGQHVVDRIYEAINDLSRKHLLSRLTIHQSIPFIQTKNTRKRNFPKPCVY